MREKGINTLSQLDNYIKENADRRQDLQDKIKVIDKDITKLSKTMEQVHTVKLYRQIYLEYKKDTTDKAFLKNINLKFCYIKILFQNSKKLTPSCQIQRIF